MASQLLDKNELNKIEGNDSGLELQITLNKRQYEAVTKPLGANVQVIAGPGTGVLLTNREKIYSFIQN